MRKVVFTEGVVEGLKKWRRRAKKNLAIRNTTSNSVWARPSLDALIETSPSFSTLDVSYSVDQLDDRLGEDDGYLSVEISDEESSRGKQVEKQQKLSSFDGFAL